MRLLTFRYENQIKTGIRTPEGIQVFKDSPSVLNIVKNGIPELSDEFIAIKDIEFLAPIQPEHDLICVGLNYQEHINEVHDTSLNKKKDAIVYFGKRCLNPRGHNQTVSIGQTEKMDYETELAVIIGKTCHNVKKEDVKDYIFGFTVANDWSARDLQSEHVQWYLGKSLDQYVSMGPWIVTIDETGYPIENNIMTLVNNEIRQSSNTDHMMNTVDEIICELSKYMTLVPGDVILTGTPSGVAIGNDDLPFLKVGDHVDCCIDHIGVLSNEIVE